MPKKQELVVEIACDGSVKLEVVGGDGKTCMDLTKDLEAQIGSVQERSYKPEFYKSGDVQKVKITGSN